MMSAADWSFGGREVMHNVLVIVLVIAVVFTCKDHTPTSFC